MKTLLICPAIRPAVPQLSEAHPLATVPILGECLVNHWIEHVAALGARHVIIHSADRAAAVQAAVGDGKRWGVRIEVIPAPLELSPVEATARYQAEGKTGWLPAPHDIVVMSHLPGCPEGPLFDSYASWFAAVIAWMPRALTPARVRVSEIRPGIWVGRRARISPKAELVAPCWIGDQAYVGARAVVGPGTIVEERAVVEAGARVALSHVARDTFIGRMTSVANSLAIGSTLVNWQTDSLLHVPDPFLLCSLARPAGANAPGWRATARTAVHRVGSALVPMLPGWVRSERTTDFKLSG